MQLKKLIKNSGLAALAIVLAAPPLASQAAAAEGQWRNRGERAVEHQRSQSSRPSTERTPSRSEWRGSERQRSQPDSYRGDRRRGDRPSRPDDRSTPQPRQPSYQRPDRNEAWRNDRSVQVQQRDQQRNRSYSNDRRNGSYRDNSRDWSYGNRERYDGRRDDRRYDDRRRYDDHRRWDRRWRDNRRYDWQSYRRANRSTFHVGIYYAPYRNYSYRRVGAGFRLNSLFFGSRYWINDPWRYRLPAAYGSYRWIRYYDDALLVDTYSGEVVDVIYDFFW
ncbi:conserved hypothetical protein [Altererythrobacter sp. B11]|uniref:RcnB family protein n=1 Tax=Altererythrobacter sp. B11 TaxID=2060312 RepID=UPI000DC6F97E|nr:RcnB family protein [Altererythrobacter sp. B11]BBC73683.1 conserved hypothetical protein [Altererythrobacter sp. B11]